MHTSKRLVQLNHILRMWRSIITLLSIPAFLNLSLQHDLGGGWADDKHVDDAGDEDGGEWVEDVSAGGGVEDTRNARGDGEG